MTDDTKSRRLLRWRSAARRWVRRSMLLSALLDSAGPGRECELGDFAAVDREFGGRFRFVNFNLLGGPRA